MQQRPVIITGVNGFIGRHLAEYLISIGKPVIGIDDFSTSVDDGFVNKLHEFYCIDLATANIDLLSEIVSTADTVYHLAAKARVQPSFLQPMRFHHTNVTGTTRLLEAMKTFDSKLVYTSTSSVYGDTIVDISPQSPYAIQKYQAEVAIQMYNDMYETPYMICRLFNVYGDGMPIGQYSQLIPTLLDQYRRGVPFTVYGDGSTRRDFTHVSDVVSIITQDHYGTINVGTGVNHSVLEICQMIDPNHPIEYLPARNEPKITKATHITHQPAQIQLPDWIRIKKESV